MMTVINRRKCRVFALECAKRNRAHEFRRVGESFLKRIEIATRQAILREIAIHPSKGKTLL